MPRDTRHHRHLRIPNRLRSIYGSLQRLRRDISKPYRRQQKPKAFPIASLSTDPPDRPSGLTSPPNASRASLARISSRDIVANPSQAMDSGASGTSPVAMPDAPPNVSAVFIHAGAGYHSNFNEHFHLRTCNEYVYMKYDLPY